MKVSELKKLTFSTLTLENKIQVKHFERPVPVLNIVQVQKKCKNKEGFTRKFDKTVYTKTPWLCGCEDTNAFFCFVCLLFGGDDNWTSSGIWDLKHFHEKKKRHANSPKHKDNIFSFQLLGKNNITIGLSQAYVEDVRRHNETVAKNRYVLGKMIEVLKFCGNSNLPLRGHNETNESTNKDVFLELIDFSRKMDFVLDNHLRHAHVFKGFSKKIQKELLQCMLEVCREHIINEINNSSFVALMIDDTTDVSGETQTVLVFRYELHGKIQERFWGFENTEDPDGLSKCILQQIDTILKDYPNKLIAQSYNGVTVKPGNIGSVNVKIKERYNYAYFIYCYGNELNKLVENVASSVISSVRIFFGNLNGISAFFSHSPEATAALQRVSDKRKLSKTQWNFHTRVVQTVFDNKADILECFKNIELGIPKQYNNLTITQAAGFVKWLEDDTFLYWLNFFRKVMPHVDVLSNQLQTIETNLVKLQTAIACFENNILGIRNSLSPVTLEEEKRMNTAAPRKRRRTNGDHLNVSALEVCDTIIIRIRECFGFTNHICGASLFVRKKFKEYKKNLPLQAINRFCETFPMIDRNNLKSELRVFYSRPETIENEEISGCLKILNFIYSFGLEAAFQELTNVLKILVTIPVITLETGRCFSSFKRIKTFLRSTTGEDSLAALGMLYIENSMVHEISNFNDKVIEKFVNDQKRRMNFQFKK